jgi:HEAT repeat protein
MLGDDQPLIVSEAGATALASLGAVLYEKDPAGAKRVAAELRNVLAKRTEQPGAEHLREVVVQALVPLRDPDMLTTYFKLLNLRESDPVRRASLQGLAALRDPRAADVVVAWLKKEPKPEERLEAVHAIGATGGIEQFETLYERMQPLNESDSSVRDAAWNVFQSLLPQATTEQINRWPGRFQFDPEKKVVVLKSLADKLQQDKNLSELAKTQQNIGEAIMKISNPTTADEAKEAATYFKLSLDYYQQNNFEPMVIETNIAQLLQAQLQSKQYPEAAQFASNLIAQSAGNQQTVGPKFKEEAERLFSNGDLQSALKLIAETRNMKPALDNNYNKQLSDIERDIQERLATQEKKDRTFGPGVNTNVRVG